LPKNASEKAESKGACARPSLDPQIFCRNSAGGGDMLLNMSDPDLDLLRQFTRDHAQDAFTALVKRHVNLVYSAALRQVRSPQLAEEIVQSVFADLARVATTPSSPLAGRDVSSRDSLTPWLYAVTRRTAVDVIRKESRRQLREQIAVEMNHMNATNDDWTQIEPLLDDAMAALDETDRSAILLRFFENKSLREVGEALGASEDAAQKRVSRAVERLREFFSKRNVTIGASGLVVLISTNAVQSAPIGLALTISNASLAAAKTTLTFMEIATATKLKLAFSAIVVAGAVTAFVFQQKNQVKLLGENKSLKLQIAQVQTDNESLSNHIAEIGDAKQLSETQFNELLKLRGETGVFRRQLDELAEKNRALENAKVSMLGSNTNSPVPQVHIKARFLTMPKDIFAGSSLGSWASNKGVSGILTSANFRNVLRQLESLNGVEVLAEPEVTTTSGRQTQMRATQIITVVNGFALQETNNAQALIPHTEPVETGPILDVMPRVLSDGYTIELPVIASVTDFLGYTPSTKTTPAYTAAGQEIDVPTVSPQFQIQAQTNSVNLLDDQTVVLALDAGQVPADATFLELDGSKSKYQDKKTLVFITATLLDPAGNRVHPDAVYTNIPPQGADQ
jgi:RNA polymerase sigma factor (sigma-70 family)